MKFTLSWLKDHLETEASLEELERTLSSIGLEVESIVDPSVELGPFTVARIVEAKQHPNADRLKLCQVEVAPGAPTVEVVCGAPNAKAGLVGVFAPLGSYIPGTGITLEERPVRGVVSNGMMLSERELNLSEDHDGIIELQSSLADQVGKPYIAVAGLDDPVIEVGITPNRPDCTGVRGIARDLAAAGLGTLKPAPDVPDFESGDACPINIELRFDDPTNKPCPVFSGRHVAGVKNGPAPAWMQRRLIAIGLRPISALVDITNYVSMDRGRPLHVYDADKIKGVIHARLGKAGETFEGLDGRDHTVGAEMCVIADDSGVLGFGGILGGESTGCTEETTNVLIESAYFDPVGTAETGRKAQLNTDARYRFERGVDPQFVVPGLDLATDWVTKLCGGTPSKSCVAGAPPDGTEEIAFDFALTEKLTGHDVSEARQREILAALGFQSGKRGTDGRATVTAPSWRPDIDGAADLVEEIIRIVGLDEVASVPLPSASDTTRSILTDLQARVRRTRRVLAGRGLVEAITYSFIPHDQAEAFGGGGDALEVANPISSDMSSMRPSLLPQLLIAGQRNRNRGFTDVALFECGQAFKDDTPEGQNTLLSGVRLGNAGFAQRGRHWDGASEPVDLFDVKQDVLAALEAIGIDPATVQVTRDAPGWYHPGRSAVIQRGPKLRLATFGEVHPATLAALDVEGPAVAFEIDLSAIPAPKQKGSAKPRLEMNDLNPVRRDFAFVVPRSTLAADLMRAAKGADKKAVTDVGVFDVFEGPSLGEDRKSIGIEVTLQPSGSTFTDEDIEGISRKIVAAVQKATGAELRS
ncbi:MAG: phenylalanine--tRNA ligase subunit beta [Pseudomonadota bacterium]